MGAGNMRGSTEGSRYLCLGFTCVLGWPYFMGFYTIYSSVILGNSELSLEPK